MFCLSFLGGFGQESHMKVMERRGILWDFSDLHKDLLAGEVGGRGELKEFFWPTLE